MPIGIGCVVLSLHRVTKIKSETGYPVHERFNDLLTVFQEPVRSHFTLFLCRSTTMISTHTSSSSYNKSVDDTTTSLVSLFVGTEYSSQNPDGMKKFHHVDGSMESTTLFLM